MMLPGALTGRLSCGHSETGQTNRRNGNLHGQALNGRSKTALISITLILNLHHSKTTDLYLKLTYFPDSCLPVLTL